MLYYASHSLFFKPHYERSTVIKTDAATKDLQHLYYRLSEKTLDVFNEALNEARNKGCLVARNIYQIDDHTFEIRTSWNSQQDFVDTYNTAEIRAEIDHLKTRGIHIKGLEFA